MNGFVEEFSELLDGMLQSYKDLLILRLQQGYEDSHYRLVSSIEEADMVHLVETDSLETEMVEAFFEEFRTLCDVYDVDWGIYG